MYKETVCRTNYHKLQRVAAVVLSAAILVVMLFSVCFISQNTCHDCMGEGCPICACIHSCTVILHQLSGGIAKTNTAAPLMTVFAAVMSISAVKKIFLSDTLISQKIRQNN